MGHVRQTNFRLDLQHLFSVQVRILIFMITCHFCFNYQDGLSHCKCIVWNEILEAREETLYPPLCLEAGRNYKVRLEFKPGDKPTSSILIDSVKYINILLIYFLMGKPCEKVVL